MDLSTLIALLTLIVLVVGGLLSLLWGKVNSISQQLADERVRSAEKYITSHEMERRLEQAIAPLERTLERMENQNNQIFQLLRRHYHAEVN
jgi:predicted Holliday junction resolvase-like endonuclease